MSTYLPNVFSKAPLHILTNPSTPINPKKSNIKSHHILLTKTTKNFIIEISPKSDFLNQKMIKLKINKFINQW